MRLMNEQFTSTVLEGEDMNEYRDVGINDVCEVTRETTAPLFSVQTSLTTVDLAQPTSTSSKASVPVSTKITTTLENTSISIQIENRGITSYVILPYSELFSSVKYFRHLSHNF